MSIASLTNALPSQGLMPSNSATPVGTPGDAKAVPSGGILTARVDAAVKEQTPAELQKLTEQRHLWGMDNSDQQGKDFERVWLLNRVVVNSDRYPGFPGKSNGEYASSMRDNLLRASQARDDALKVIAESGQSERPWTLFGLGASSLSKAWEQLDRADAALRNVRPEIDSYLQNGSSRRFYLEAPDPKRL